MRLLTLVGVEMCVRVRLVLRELFFSSTTVCLSSLHLSERERGGEDAGLGVSIVCRQRREGEKERKDRVSTLFVEQDGKQLLEQSSLASMNVVDSLVGMFC